MDDHDVTRHTMGKTHRSHKKILAQSNPLRSLSPPKYAIDGQVNE